MFSTLVSRVLTSRLGKFLAGLDSISVGLWAGEVTASNVQLREEVLEVLGLPFTMVSGVVGRLAISVPWTRLSTASVTVDLSDLMVILRPIDLATWEMKDETYIESIVRELEGFELRLREMYESKLLSGQERTDRLTYLQQLLGTVLDNLIITVSNVHFRVESTFENRLISCGVILKSVRISNDEGLPPLPGGAKARKRILIQSVSAYCNPAENRLFLPDENFQVNMNLMQKVPVSGLILSPGTIYVVDIEAKTVHFDKDSGPYYSAEVSISNYAVEINPEQLKTALFFNRLISDYMKLLSVE